MKKLLDVILSFIYRKWNIRKDVFLSDELYNGNAIVIVAPHTSYEDAFVGKALINRFKWNYVFLSARKFFKFPTGLFFRWFGCVPIGGLKGRSSIQQVVEMFKTHNNLKVVICPEGHLAPVDKWKAGFYYMAYQANVPIFIVGLNYDKKEAVLLDIISASMTSALTFDEMMAFINQRLLNNVAAKYPKKFRFHKLKNNS